MFSKETGLIFYNVFLLGFIMAFSIYLLFSYKNLNSCNRAIRRGHNDMIAGYSAAVFMALLLILILAYNCN
jgi:ABC-type Co2+ transport system permease subunit